MPLDGALPDVFLPYQQELWSSVSLYAVTVAEKSRRTGFSWALGAIADGYAASSKASGGMDVLYMGYDHEMAREFIDYVKARPGEINYGSSGVGSIHHLSMEALMAPLQLKMTHIPYRGTGQSVPALLGGHVQVLFAAYPSLAGAAESKKVKLLAQNGEGRWFQAPDVPAVSEVISNFDLATIVGLYARPGVPQAVIDKITAEAIAAATINGAWALRVADRKGTIEPGKDADLVVLDAVSRKEAKRVPIGHGAAGILMQPDGQRAYVSCTPDDYIVVIDLKSLTVTGKITAGKHPDGLAWAVRK